MKFELGIRSGIALAAAVAALALELPRSGVVVQAAVAVAAYSGVLALLERRGMRGIGVATAASVADSVALSVGLHAAGLAENFGFVVLAPLADGIVRWRANAHLSGPLASAALVVLAYAFGGEASSLLGVQAAAILGVTLVLGLPARAPAAEPEAEEPLPVLDWEDGAEPVQPHELRSRYRDVAAQYQDLQRRSASDRAAAALLYALHDGSEPTPVRIAREVQRLSGAEGVALYAVSQVGESLSVRASVGGIPQSLATASLPFEPGSADLHIRRVVDGWMGALVDDERRPNVGTTILKHRGRVVGAVALTHPRPAGLARCMQWAEVAAPALAVTLCGAEDREQLRRRTREGELLYSIATVVAGAGTSLTLASRAVRELHEILGVDHVSLWVLDGDEAIPAASTGPRVSLLAHMSFFTGPGVKGWLEASAPELAIFDAREDSRCPSAEALRQRVGSFCVVPIQVEEKPFGYLMIASAAVRGVDVAELETLRIVAAELGHAFVRIERPAEPEPALTTPEEFQERVARSQGGCLVYLDPHRIKESEETFGRPAVDHALRTFAHRIRARLPVGSMLCRRPERDFVAFLDGHGEGFARSWANEVSAVASMIGLRTPDGRARIPLAIRAKVAEVDWRSKDRLREAAQSRAENAA